MPAAVLNARCRPKFERRRKRIDEALELWRQKAVTDDHPQPHGGAPVAALVRFHLRVGARLALREAAPAIGLPLTALLLQQEPGGAMRGLAARLTAPPGDYGSGLAVAGVACVLAAWAAPRVTAGMNGWSRHLPVSGTAQRRAALASLVIVQAPLLVAWLLLALLAVQAGHHVAQLRVAAVVVTACAAALAAWPSAPSWHRRALAMLALLLAAGAQAAGLVGAIVLVVVSDRLTGPCVDAKGTVRRRSGFVPIPVLIGVRALGGRLAVAPLVAMIPLAAMLAFRTNNDLPPAVAAGAARLGGGLAVGTLIALLIERLAVRRPVWCWARSLPSDAMQRVGQDAALLGTPCVMPLVVTAWMEPMAALTVAVCVPFLALRAAGAVRRSLNTKMGPAAPALAEAALLACYVALVPWLAVAALAALPFAWRAAVTVDRRQKVSRWEERHHRTSGDPMSWNAR